MFSIGDKVVYPMHGAGVIEAIEEKEVLGKKRKYYIMKLPLGEMRVMVPLENAEDSRMRQIIDDDGYKKVVDILKGHGGTMDPNWNHRYRANMEKIKSGNIYEVAEVVRNLSAWHKEKGLSNGEKKMLDNARQILISELVLVKGAKKDQMEEMIEKLLA
ncbi:MAG: CarD family transcriptional regulator [Zhaonellaceae bacterium]|jgi:CarD family transcriptional regulator|nr:CarD family transcriptional regulator [Clostridia bacterium]